MAVRPTYRTVFIISSFRTILEARHCLFQGIARQAREQANTEGTKSPNYATGYRCSQQGMSVFKGVLQAALLSAEIRINPAGGLKNQFAMICCPEIEFDSNKTGCYT